MPKKGVKTGPRVTVEWGTIKKKVNGKSVTVRLSSQVVQTTAKLFGLKESKGTTVGATTKSIKAKNGTRLILTGGVAKVGTKKLYASVDGKVFHQMPIPIGLSLARAFAILKSGKKAYEIKFQGGTSRIIGKPSKDTKSKAKDATATKK